MIRRARSDLSLGPYKQRSALPKCLALLAICMAGCSSSEINSTYGERSGRHSNSVNGTAVFGSMFRDAGHKVTTVHRISPRLERFNVVVWAPNEFSPPNRNERAFFERWLAQKQRTLIYIGRDYDAEPEYWEMMAGSVAPEKALEMWRRRAAAISSFDERRAVYGSPEFGRWFTRYAVAPYQTAENITATDPKWLQGIDVSKLRIVIGAALRPAVTSDIPQAAPPKPGTVTYSEDEDALSNLTAEERQRQATPVSQSEVLIQTEHGPLLTRVHEPQWQQSSLLVVSNGSFLLNLPLVNVEHRKLAGKLITACGSSTNIAFLETSPYDDVSYGDEEDEMQSGWAVFTVWPLGIIVMHAFLVGIVACFALFPIFGRPREQPEDSQGDFGKHIEALGKLLQRTQDEIYARDQVQQYYRQVRGDIEERT